MRGVPGYPTMDFTTDRNVPSDHGVDRKPADATDGGEQATMRSANALVRGFDRGDISCDLLVRDLRIKAFRCFVIDPLRRAVRRVMSRLHQ